MSDYQKLNIRFSNFGLNLAHDQSTLPFGKYAVLNNLVSDFEANLRPRPGMQKLHTLPVLGSPVITGFRRLNDSIGGTAKYLIRAGTNLFVTSGVAAGFTVGGTALATGFNTNFGTIIPYRPNISAKVWAYLGDATKMIKTDGTLVQPIGYVRPTGAITYVSEAATGALTLLGTYQYRFSFYSSVTGAESRFNSGGDTSHTLTGANNQINIEVPTASPGTGVDKARIYRKGGTVDTWRLLTTVSYTGGVAVSYSDATSDITISGAIVLDEDSDQPFITTNSSGTDVSGTALPYLSDPVFGYILAVGDPNNPGYLYWTNKFDPDRQDPDNRVEVTSPQDPLQNVVVFNGTPYAFSKEAVYELVVGLGESTFTPIRTPCRNGLFTPQAITVGDQIYFMAKDGLYATNGGGDVSITDGELRPLFMGNSVNGYSPIDFTQTQFFRMAYLNNELWFMYVGLDGLTHFIIYHSRYGRWRAANFRNDTGSVYADEETLSQLVFGSADGWLELHAGTVDEGGTPTSIPTELATGYITLGSPLIHKEWGQLVVDLNPNSTVVGVYVYSHKGATLIGSGSASGASRTKLYVDLGQAFSEDIQLVFSAAGVATYTLYGYELFYRQEEPQAATYSVTGVTHGLMGWQVLRSAYITLRSNGVVNFIVDVYNDNGTRTSTTYPLTSTAEDGGIAAGKGKLYVPFAATKGKLFGYRLEGVDGAVFRFYPEESEIHVKQWITSIGYQRANPFLGGGAAQDGGGFDQAASPTMSGGTVGGGGGGGLGSAAGGSLAGGFDFLGGGGDPVQPPAVDSSASNQYTGNGRDTGNDNGNPSAGGQFPN